MKSWDRLRTFTKARVGLGQTGVSLPTQWHLETRKSLALARDSLWRPWDYQSLKDEIRVLGHIPFTLATKAEDRQSYLARPDWGRTLNDESAKRLSELSTSKKMDYESTVVFCISDGLSAEASMEHMAHFLRIFLPQMQQNITLSNKPFLFVLLPFARVAAADQVGEILQAKLTVIFVGERPGLSAHNSMGIYMTYNPSRGSDDAMRNCISNVRPPDGLSYEMASTQLCYLIRESLVKQLSGVDLKMDLGDRKLDLPAAVGTTIGLGVS